MPTPRFTVLWSREKRHLNTVNIQIDKPRDPLYIGKPVVCKSKVNVTNITLGKVAQASSRRTEEPEFERIRKPNIQVTCINLVQYGVMVNDSNIAT